MYFTLKVEKVEWSEDDQKAYDALVWKHRNATALIYNVAFISAFS